MQQTPKRFAAVGVIAAASLSLPLFAPSAVRAQGYSVRAVAGTTLTGQDTKEVFNGPTQVSASTTESASGSFARADTVARVGSLSAYALSTAPSLPPQQIYRGLNASSTASFTDTIRLDGPAGGSLLVTFSIDLSGSFINSSPGNRTGAAASANLQVIGGNVNQTIVLNWNALDAGPTGTSTITARIPYNTAIRLLGGLNASVGTVQGTGTNQALVAEADFSHTARFSVTPAEATSPTNPFSMTSASGFGYAAVAAAPEPGAAALLAAGVLPVIAFARRRKSR